MGIKRRRNRGRRRRKSGRRKRIIGYFKQNCLLEKNTVIDIEVDITNRHWMKLTSHTDTGVDMKHTQKTSTSQWLLISVPRTASSTLTYISAPTSPRSTPPTPLWR